MLEQADEELNQAETKTEKPKNVQFLNSNNNKEDSVDMDNISSSSVNTTNEEPPFPLFKQLDFLQDAPTGPNTGPHT